MSIQGLNANTNVSVTENTTDSEGQKNPKMPPLLINEELSPEVQQRINVLEAILQASDKKSRTEAITQAANTLGKSTRTIKRMLARVEKEGVATLAVGRNDNGQFRICDQWFDFIVDTYKWGQREGSRRNINQVYVSLMALASQGERLTQETHNQKGFVKRLKDYPLVLEDLIAGKYPSHVTVYKIIKTYLEEKKKAQARHPGSDVEHQVIQTTEGILKITHSNQIWQADHTKLDILLVEKKEDGDNAQAKAEVIGRPFLTLVMDSHSGCIAGFYLGFEAAGSHEVALALRHAILPKQYGEEYSLENEWNVHGIPEYLVTDRAKEFKCNHIKQVAMQLVFQRRLRAFPSAGGLIESIFDKLNKEILSDYPGYTGSSIEERPEHAEKHACLTLDDLEKRLVKYFVDHYNWHNYPRVATETRARRWALYLLVEPKILNERELDICLMKVAQRKVQKYGCIQFNNLIYQGECLVKYQSQEISFRYDQRNIITLLAYIRAKNGQPSEFIGVVKARYFKHEQISLEELKWIIQKLRKQVKEVDNISILNERYNQLNFIEAIRHKKRKHRKKAQQHRDQTTNQSKVLEIFPQNTQQLQLETSLSQEQSVTETCKQQTVTAINEHNKSQIRRTGRVRRSGTKANVDNWDEYVKNNW